MIVENIWWSLIKCEFSNFIGNCIYVSASKEFIGESVPEVSKIERGLLS